MTRRPGARAGGTGAAGLAIGLTLVGIAVAVAATGGAAASPLRHAYLVPVVAAALRWGGAGGLGAGTGAALLHAPFVLPTVERSGVTAAVGEGLVTFANLLLVGGLAGVLATRARRDRARYEAILTVGRALEDAPPLVLALGRLRACLAERLGASGVALVVREGERLTVGGGDGVASGSAMALALERGTAVWVPDTGAGPRPRRVFVAPLTARGEAIGALAVERVGELPRGERADLETLGAHLGVALENARLTARQRRFADELAEKVAAATRRIEAMDRAKSAFVAMASHELRTPLTALQGFSELLGMRALPPNEVRRLAGIIQGETERLARMVDDLLDLSRLERGLPPTLRRAAVPVEPAITAAVDLLRRGSARHRFVIECDGPLPPVDADPDALDRVLKNLISNAIKYSPVGSCVRVTAGAVAARDAVVIDVEDEGCGIPPDALPRVFEPYYRAPGVAGAARGAGLGLAVVKALVESHGGSIAIESAPARGTRVRVILPAVP